MPLPAHLAGQEWTPDRVQNELVREDQGWPRYELLDGDLLVSPAPRPAHQRAVARLLRRLDDYVEQQGLGEVLMAPADIRLGTRTTLQPDIFVIPPDGGAAGTSWDSVSALSLVVEVLSPGTAGYDRITKREFYARRQVPEYWVVDCDVRAIEVTRADDPRVEVHTRELRWHPSGAAEPLVIDLPAYFERVLGPA